MRPSSVIHRMKPPPTSYRFRKFLMIPAARGGRHGFIGNGAMVKIIQEIRSYEIMMGSLPSDWTAIKAFKDIWPGGVTIVYYRCPRCGPRVWL